MGDGREPGPDGQREMGDEGEAGKRDAEPTRKKYAVKGPPDTEQPVLSREAQQAQAFTGGVIGTILAAQQNAPTSIFGAEFAVGRDPIAALGALHGDLLGESHGYGGLGSIGTGRGAGGDGKGTIGTGTLATVGSGQGGTGYGSRAGRLGPKKDHTPQVRMLSADVRGSLSKEVIRRVIHRNLPQVRYCYQDGLQSRPDLEGRVAIKFIISASGTVQAAVVGDSTLGNASVERCISTAVKRWTFPAPEGGGIVAVSYPFVLSHTGG